MAPQSRQRITGNQFRFWSSLTFQNPGCRFNGAPKNESYQIRLVCGRTRERVTGCRLRHWSVLTCQNAVCEPNEPLTNQMGQTHLLYGDFQWRITGSQWRFWSSLTSQNPGSVFNTVSLEITNTSKSNFCLRFLVVLAKKFSIVDFIDLL